MAWPETAPPGPQRTRGPVPWTLIAFIAAFALFLPSVTEFKPRVIDLGALRILDGDVPYRDFWTMYSPGSFYLLAGAFAVFGRELIVSNLLGVLTAAAGVAALHRFASAAMPPHAAVVPAALFAVTYVATGYHLGVGTYPPVILCFFLAGVFLCRFGEGGGRRKLVCAGVCLGFATLFKHDVGAYGCIAAAAALVLAGVPAGETRWRTIPILAGSVVLVVLPAAAALVLVGAGPDAWADLVVFPLTDFPLSRKESFPSLLPPSEGRVKWWQCVGPLYVLVVALPFLWMRRATFPLGGRHALMFCLVAFPLFWRAAHLQINTHPNSMTAVATVLGAAAFLTSQAGRVARWIALAFAIVWGGAVLKRPLGVIRTKWEQQGEPLALPRTAGIRVGPDEARSLRALAADIASAAPPEAPLLLLGRRNDVMVYLWGAGYWVSDRPFVTRHQELHPAVTDTEPVQRRMLEDIARGPLPVLVREHRFDDATIERTKAAFLADGLPVGATLLDDWVAARYREGPRFGMYEVMRPR